MRDPITGQMLPWASPRENRRATRRIREWAGEFPDESEIDLYLVTSRSAHSAVREVQERVGRLGVTVTAELDRMTTFPVDRPLSAQYAVMPRDARDARDFHGKPLMFVDARRGRPMLILVAGATKHVEALKEQADEMRHYGTDVPETPPSPDIAGDYHQWIEQAEDHKAGRKRYAYGKTDAVEGDWLDKVKVS